MKLYNPITRQEGEDLVLDYWDSPMPEEWKDVEGYEGFYQISTFGKVRSLDRVVKNPRGTMKRKGVLIKFTVTRDGYNKFTLSKDGNHKSARVHQEVLKAFVPNIDNKPQINHINGIKTDNRVENLEWCTASENQQHCSHVLGRKSPMLGRFTRPELTCYCGVKFRQKKDTNIYCSQSCAGKKNVNYFKNK